MGRPMTGSGGMMNIVPGTAFGRPPTGGARLSTAARLRTGNLNLSSSPGMQAAQGYTLGMNINIQDRPMTGQGLGGLRLKTGTGSRIVEDAAYYIGLLRNRINDVTIETKRLQKILDSNIKESTTLANLEKKHENLLKAKDIQEGQLADFNLALDKTRTSTDPETVSDQANEITERNKQNRIELDRIFALRKDRESELIRIEDQTEQILRDTQTRVQELDPSKQRVYKELSNKQKEFEVSINNTEAQLLQVNERIGQLEAENSNNPHRKEYLLLEKQYQQLRSELVGLQSEAEIMQLPAKEAQAKYVARVNEFKQGAKACDEKAAQLRDYIIGLKNKVKELDKKLQDQPKQVTFYFIMQYDIYLFTI